MNRYGVALIILIVLMVIGIFTGLSNYWENHPTPYTEDAVTDTAAVPPKPLATRPMDEIHSDMVVPPFSAKNMREGEQACAFPVRGTREHHVWVNMEYILKIPCSGRVGMPITRIHGGWRLRMTCSIEEDTVDAQMKALGWVQVTEVVVK